MQAGEAESAQVIEIRSVEEAGKVAVICAWQVGSRERKSAGGSDVDLLATWYCDILNQGGAKSVCSRFKAAAGNPQEQYGQAIQSVKWSIGNQDEQEESIGDY